MSKKELSDSKRVSRRSFLSVAAVGGGALFGTGLIGASPAAAKLPQNAAKYQPTPKGKQRCDNCALWQAPASCKLVDGTISPTGWCVLYQVKR